jgi:predicted amidohydrolase YtcJ
MFLSLFPSHTFYWGDWHRQVTFGAERAANISATGYAHTIGIPFGIHTDAPVIPVSQLDALYRAVNRTTRSDLVLGPEERVSHYVGLQALTSMPAWLYFEEESKGSLKEGKLADMIILDKNPLKVDPEVIKNIQVLETIKEGRTVYQKKTNEKIQFAPFAGV